MEVCGEQISISTSPLDTSARWKQEEGFKACRYTHTRNMSRLEVWPQQRDWAVWSILHRTRRFYSESDHNNGGILHCPDSVTMTHTVGGSFLPRKYQLPRLASLDNDRVRWRKRRVEKTFNSAHSHGENAAQGVWSASVRRYLLQLMCKTAPSATTISARQSLWISHSSKSLPPYQP